MSILAFHHGVRLYYCLLITALLFVSNSRADEFLLGVNTHFGQVRGDITKNLDAGREAGINSIRDEVYWEGMECCEKGKLWIPRAWKGWAKTLDDATEQKLNPLIILGFGHRFHGGGAFPKSPDARSAFLKYVKFTATRFVNDVRMYEVWNEWNLGAGDRTRKGPGDPVVYYELLADVHKAIKEINASSVVLGGAIAGLDWDWIEKLVQLGALKYMDGLSIHPYNFCAEPMESKPEIVIGSLLAMENRLLKYSGGKEVPIYVTEIGWPTHTGKCSYREEDAANYLARFFLGIRLLPFVKGAWWYDFQNDGTVLTDKEHNFGLITASYQRKPAFYAMKDIAHVVKVSDEIVQESKQKEVKIVRFSEKKTPIGLAIWYAGKEFSWSASLRNNGTTAVSVAVKDVGSNRSAVTHNIAAGGSIFLEVVDRPVLVSGGIRDVEVFLIQGAKKSGLMTKSKPDDEKKDDPEKSEFASPIE